MLTVLQDVWLSLSVVGSVTAVDSGLMRLVSSDGTITKYRAIKSQFNTQYCTTCISKECKIIYYILFVINSQSMVHSNPHLIGHPTTK